jgi:hypothetical protein
VSGFYFLFPNVEKILSFSEKVLLPVFEWGFRKVRAGDSFQKSKKINDHFLGESGLSENYIYPSGAASSQKSGLPLPTDHMLSIFFGNPIFGLCENHGKLLKFSYGFFCNSAIIEFEVRIMIYLDSA